MTTKIPRLVVFGGSGFLGTQICRFAAMQNWNVTSLSRSGEPSSQRLPWAHKVTWAKADVFHPETYEEYLKDADAVVHSMGILLEANYKPLLRQGVKGEGNPLLKSEGSDGGKGGRLTYEMMNRDSAITLAKSFSKHSQAPNKTMVYISAAAGFVLLPNRYISTKREAEEAIAGMPDLRSISIRPGFLYSATRPVTMPLSYLVSLSSTMNTLTFGIFKSLLGAAAEKPTEVDVVGRAVVAAIRDTSVSGVVDPEGIIRLSKDIGA